MCRPEDLACNPGRLPDGESNRQPLSLWDDAQATEPHGSGQKFIEFLCPGNFKEGSRNSINSLENTVQVLVSLSQHPSNTGEWDQVWHLTMVTGRQLAHSWGTGIHLLVSVFRMSWAQKSLWRWVFEQRAQPFPGSLHGQPMLWGYRDSACRPLPSSRSGMWYHWTKMFAEDLGFWGQGELQEECTQFCLGLDLLPSVTMLSA